MWPITSRGFRSADSEMNRTLYLLLSLLWFVLGLMLVVVPWLGFWESNYFLNRFPSLIPYLLNPYLRGAVSGLGLLDAFLATEAFHRPPSSVAVRN